MTNKTNYKLKNRNTYVVGVGMTKITRYNRRSKQDNRDYPQLVKEAASKAFVDCGLSYDDVQAGIVGYCYGDSTAGQRALYECGLTGIPILNVNNNCSTGSSSIFTARSMIQGGYDCVLAVGFEVMIEGLSQVYTDKSWTAPTELHFKNMYEFAERDPRLSNVNVSKDLASPKFNAFTDNVLKVFAYAAREHMLLYGSTPQQFAKVAYKNHRQSVNNPYSMNRKEYSLDQIMESPMQYHPFTALQICATGCGAAAAVICSEDFVRDHNLWRHAVEIVAQEMVTDVPSSFTENSFMKLSGYQLAKVAADRVYQAAGISPKDLDILEVHDCFSCNELFMYEALGLCDIGKGGVLIDEGEWKDNGAKGSHFILGNRWVVNPSGGLISKGHPIGATGIAQCHELVLQLRGQAGRRQVKDAKLALQHNFGIGSAAVVTLYRGVCPDHQSRL